MTTAIAITCAACGNEFAPSTDDLTNARVYEAEIIATEGVAPSSDDSELMDRFGRDICSECETA